MAMSPRRRAGPDPQRRVSAEIRQAQRRLEQAWAAYRRLEAEPGAEPAPREAIARDVLIELQVQAALDESVLYPAARAAGADAAWLDAAEVEHEQMEALRVRLLGRHGDIGETKFETRFARLCEAARRQLARNRRELLPELVRVGVDWQALGDRLAQRRQELSAVLEAGPAVYPAGEPLGVQAEAGDVPDNGVVRPGEGITSRKLAD